MKIENIKLKIIFFGTPSFVIPVLEILAKHFEVVGIVTTPDVISGRKKLLTPSPVKIWTLTNLPQAKIITPEELNNEAMQQLNNLRPDLLVTAAYGKLIPDEILKIPQYGALNIHPSLLPKYRGPSPIQTAILNGDKETGITIIKMDEKLDHGPIIVQEKCNLNGKETFESLHVQLFEQAANLLLSIIEPYRNGKIIPTAQDESKVSFCKKITKQDGFFALENLPSKDELDRMTRAFYPWPTAWTKIEINNEIRMVKFLPENKIQLEGKNVMSIKDFLNGYPNMRVTMNNLLATNY